MRVWRELLTVRNRVWSLSVVMAFCRELLLFLPTSGVRVEWPRSSHVPRVAVRELMLRLESDRWDPAAIGRDDPRGVALTTAVRNFSWSTVEDSLEAPRNRRDDDHP
jgi:hypothetical protein